MNSTPETQKSTIAFTLVELLVVITILVVLLALLAPAMDQAIYQAELGVCGSQLRATAGGILLYATDHKRQYPIRPGVEARFGLRTPELLASLGDPALPNHYDNRPSIAAYLSISKTLRCPLVARGELVQTDSDTTHVYSNYGMLWGWRYNEGQKLHPAMRRVGDSLGWSWDYGQGSREYRFRVLAADSEEVHFGNNWIHAGHPDKAGALSLWTLNDQRDENPVLAPYKFVISLWIRSGGTGRGAMDRNFVYDDGSVERIENLKMDVSNMRADERLIPAPARANTNMWPEMRIFLPGRP